MAAVFFTLSVILPGTQRQFDLYHFSGCQSSQLFFVCLSYCFAFWEWPLWPLASLSLSCISGDIKPWRLVSSSLSLVWSSSSDLVLCLLWLQRSWWSRGGETGRLGRPLPVHFPPWLGHPDDARPQSGSGQQDGADEGGLAVWAGEKRGQVNLKWSFLIGGQDHASERSDLFHLG